MSNPYEENSDPARVTLENRGGRKADDPVREGTGDEYPDPGELADADDDLDWDRDRDGRMRDYATDDDDVTTVPYDDTDDAGA